MILLFCVLMPSIKHEICSLGCWPRNVLETGLLIFRGKKSKISRDFQGQIRGKIGRFRGIFAGKKSKFAEQSADFTGEKSKFAEKSADFAGF